MDGAEKQSGVVQGTQAVAISRILKASLGAV
jgi:hypothetical protein